MRNFFTTITLLALLPITVLGNALNVTNFSVDQAAGTVTFDIDWQNSWRVDGAPVNSVPYNWDAVWLFVKFRECGAASTVDWTHGNVTGATPPAALETVLSDGSGTGIDTDNRGVLVRQATPGIYASTGPHTITMSISNLPAAGTDIDVKAFGIEMVFVPEGNYNLGDGNASSGSSSTNVFTSQTISSEAAITIDGISLPAAYPKGYAAFHCMKYEISQGQYADFLNTITGTAQTALFPGQNGTQRHTIVNTGTPPEIHVANRPDRACNYLDWRMVSAYLDWAGLRPLTELEYEKATRGEDPPIVNEMAWGNTVYNFATTISTTVPTENGTEIIIAPADANVQADNTLMSGGDGGYGPLRVGIFATPTTTTRVQSGATYYGILDMSGNIAENVIVASTNASGYDGTWGDGAITAGGEHNVASWPAPIRANLQTDNGTNGNRYVGYRGGSFEDRNTGNPSLRTSDRYNCQYTWSSVPADDERGGRGAR